MKSHASMNRIYRLVWNAALNLWVAVAENAKGRGKGGSVRSSVDCSSVHKGDGGNGGDGGSSGFRLNVARKAAAGVLASFIFLAPQANAADAANAAVVAGAGTVATAGNTTTINQTTQKLAIDWTSLSTRANEALVFNQPNASAIALNRIIGSGPSELLGSLTANGQVFILNPNGVLFGAGSQVNVGGLVASTLSMSNADFMAGNHVFSNNGSSGSVVNQGTMTAASGGYLALLAPEVRNEGVMTASLGTALLAAGNKVTLNLDNGSLLGYSIDQGAINALAENKQLIKADGGQVLLSAKAMDALTTATVNNTGVIEARTLQNVAGRIMLMGDMQTGTVNVAGTLDASAPNGGNGGFVETSAANVSVGAGTKLTTKATNGQSGTWLIDPVDFTIAAGAAAQTTSGIGADTLSSSLNSGNVSIATSASTAGNGDIFVNSALNWSSTSALSLTALRNININSAITATNGGLTLSAVNQISAPAAVNVGTFTLANGVWSQTGALPAFSAKDFGISGGTFIRALAGDGSSAANAYQITDVYGLQGAGSAGMLTKFYTLANDVDAAGTTLWNNSAGFKPIGDGNTFFMGSLDGASHVVNKLTINRPTTDDVGLFGFTDTGSSVANLGLTEASVRGGSDVGALVGNGRGTVSNSYATGSVRGDSDVGGLVGYSVVGTISNSYATGSVTGTYEVGGLVGASSSSTISNSYATGSVTGSDTVGGLVGYSFSDRISNSYATGPVTAGSAGGGLVGYNGGGTVSNSFWNTQTTGQARSAGGTGITTAQMMQASTFTNWSIAAAGGSTNIWRIYEGYTAPLLRSFLTPLNLTPTYDGSAAVQANIGNVGMPGGTNAGQLLGTPTIGGTLTLASNGTSGASGSFTASASTAGLYSTQQGYDLSATRTIATPGIAAGDINVANSINYTNGSLVINAAGNASLNGISSANGSVALSAGGNITNTGATNVALFDLKAGNWSQLGSSLPAFSATDFRISGGSFLRALGGDGASASTAYQLFDVYGLQGAGSSGMLVKHYKLFNNVDASSTVNWNSNAGFNPIGDSNTFFDGTFDGNSKTINGLTINRAALDYVGLFGYLGGTSTVTNVGLVGGSVTGRSYVGALVGANEGTMSNAYATGSVSGINNIGGLVGISYGLVGNAYSTGSVSGNYIIGGLVGYNSGLISNAYSTGQVNGIIVGGLVGYTNGGSVTNGFWNTQTSGQPDPFAAPGSTGTGITTAQMLQAATFAGWDVASAGGSTAVWRIYEGQTGPLLRSFLTARTLADTVATYNGATQTATAAGASITDASGRNVGAYASYSNQQGYDLSGGSLIINKAILSVTGVVADNKTYDGTGAATLSNIGMLSGLVGAETLALSQTGATFDNKNAGTGKVVTATGYGIADGSGGTAGLASNYQLASTSATTSANIDKVTLSVTGVVADNRTYNGTDVATLSNIGMLSGLVGAETLALSQTAATFDNKNAGTGKLVTAAGYAIADGAGGLASNYQLASTTATATADINQASLTVVAGDATRIADGTAYSGGNGVRYSGFVAGETAALLGGSLVYGGPSQGASAAGTYAITPGGLVSNGNYMLGFVNGALTLTPGGAESSALGGTELVSAYRSSLNTLGGSGLLPTVSVDDGKGKGDGDAAAAALNAAAAEARQGGGE